MRKGRLVPFLTVAVSGEVLYSAFEAFKGALMIPLQEMLGISQTQFGLLMTYVGLALFFYLPAGWINNRFRVRTIILCSLGWRLVTYLVLFLLDPPFGLMAAIAVTWAIVDAIVWPAVANGVCVLAADEDQKGRGLAMGLLESIRRFVEFALNGIVIVVLMFLPDATTTVMRVFAIAYTLLIVPMMIAVVRYVPDTRIATQARASHSVAALKGLLHVLSRPRIWLAGIAAMTVYWADINLMYVSAPYLQQVFHVSTAMSGAFGLLNTGLVAIVAGVVSGIVSDYVFKSSTRMMAVALGCVAVTCGLVLLLPVTRVMIIPILVLLIVVALATFLGKSVILAPIGELELPEEIAGSAMAVGSFLAYASILWGYNLNGYLLDSHASDPAAGYRIIFMITAGVTVIGCATAVILDRVNRRAAMRVDTVDGAADADDRTAADS
jgi:membrane protein, transporter, MFS superfamily